MHISSRFGFLMPVALMLGLGLALGNAQAQVTPPDELVKQVTADLRTAIAERREALKADPKALQALIEELVVPHFDIPRITRLVLGLHGREATPEQLERFGEAFKGMLFRSYASALVEYEDDVKIDWRPLRLAPDAKRAIVQSTLIRKDAPPVPIGFVMQLKDDGWKVFDLTVENISLVNNFRAQLNNQISRDGLDAVTQKLEGGQIEPEAPGVGENN